MSGGICHGGWDGKSVKYHVETANDTAEIANETAGNAMELAKHNAGKIESIDERLAKLEGTRNE